MSSNIRMARERGKVNRRRRSERGGKEEEGGNWIGRGGDIDESEQDNDQMWT